MARWRTGGTLREIARKYGLALSSLHRHLSEHIPAQLRRSEDARRDLSAEELNAIRQGEREAAIGSRKGTDRLINLLDGALFMNRGKGKHAGFSKELAELLLTAKRTCASERHAVREWVELEEKLAGELVDRVEVGGDPEAIMRLFSELMKLVPKARVKEAVALARREGFLDERKAV